MRARRPWRLRQAWPPSAARRLTSASRRGLLAWLPLSLVWRRLRKPAVADASGDRPHQEAALRLAVSIANRWHILLPAFDGDPHRKGEPASGLHEPRPLMYGLRQQPDRRGLQGRDRIWASPAKRLTWRVMRRDNARLTASGPQAGVGLGPFTRLSRAQRSHSASSNRNGFSARVDRLASRESVAPAWRAASAPDQRPLPRMWRGPPLGWRSGRDDPGVSSPAKSERAPHALERAHAAPAARHEQGIAERLIGRAMRRDGPGHAAWGPPAGAGRGPFTPVGRAQSGNEMALPRHAVSARVDVSASSESVAPARRAARMLDQGRLSRIRRRLALAKRSAHGDSGIPSPAKSQPAPPALMLAHVMRAAQHEQRHEAARTLQQKQSIALTWRATAGSPQSSISSGSHPSARVGASDSASAPASRAAAAAVQTAVQPIRTLEPAIAERLVQDVIRRVDRRMRVARERRGL
jgi:hypothetical protein